MVNLKLNMIKFIANIDYRKLNGIAISLGPGQIYPRQLALNYSIKLANQYNLPVYPVNSHEGKV